MPIMATHNEQPPNFSSTTFFSNDKNTSYPPASPTLINSRKRKQQQHDFQFDNMISDNDSNTVLDNLYQSWNNSQHQENFIVPITSSSSSTASYHQTQQNNNNSQLMNNSWNRSSPSSASANDAFHFNHNQDSLGGVGENAEIHQILNLDHFMDSNKNNSRALHLNDLGNQKLIHQAWSPQHQQSFNTGASSPGFFTPGFLESLQEDENESPESFPFHSTSARNWVDKTSLAMQHDTIMTPERALVSQQQASLALFHSGPSSPIPSSTSSPSPPTPFHSTKLVEEVVSMDHRRSLQVGVMNARFLQHAVNEAKLRPIIGNYLSGGGDEKTVIILTSKVAQKSYGTEKRFLCPPPTAILVGTSWWTNGNGQQIENTNEILKIGHEELNPPKLTVSISSETSTSQSGQIEWYTVSGTAVGQTGHVKSQQQLNHSNLQQQSEHPSRFRSSSESRSNSVDWYHNHRQEPLSAGKCVSKHLYINDADEKRKRVECMIKIQLANGFQFGNLTSKGIKVISKPSKKRQSVKNMELCIHHGTTVSLFNRIRSQTVSTKYLGVSSSNSTFSFPGQKLPAAAGNGTCFVARTTSWDPFVIWVVDTTRSPGDANDTDTPEDFIGRNSNYTKSIQYPPPPAIALKNKTGHLIPIHYNQHVVLQCLTTGLVSPVMIIRKVDKASTVVGGAQTEDDNLSGGGEYGDEILGDPVSQLHKIALQIVQDPSIRQQKDHYMLATNNMMPRSSHPITYLACLNDMVGMHKTTEPRKPITPPPQTTATTSTSSTSTTSSVMNWDVLDIFDISAQGEKVVRKRRLSTDHNNIMPIQQQRIDEYHSGQQRKSSMSSIGSIGRRSSVSNNNNINQALGAYWNEDVSDAAVWTIVGTDCATYTFLSPTDTEEINASPPIQSPFPLLTSFTTKPSTDDDEFILTLHGENFSRDIQVWFGDQKALQTEYRTRELLTCKAPSRNDLLETKRLYNEIPILLVRGDGTICRTNKLYPF